MDTWNKKKMVYWKKQWFGLGRTLESFLEEIGHLLEFWSWWDFAVWAQEVHSKREQAEGMWNTMGGRLSASNILEMARSFLRFE